MPTVVKSATICRLLYPNQFQMTAQALSYLSVQDTFLVVHGSLVRSLSTSWIVF